MIHADNNSLVICQVGSIAFIPNATHSATVASSFYGSQLVTDFLICAYPISMMPFLSRILTFYSRNRYGFLFFSLLLSLMLLPVSRSLDNSGTVIQILLATSLFAGVMALEPGFARSMTMLALLLTFAAKPVTALLDLNIASLWSQLVWALFTLLMAGSSITHSLRGRAIGSEQIYAALSAYLLAGLFFGQVYWVLDQFVPGSLGSMGAAVESSISNFTAIYFSFVTLASLGYGDIVPLSDPARGLAVIEVIGGQLYLAVLVARLVGVVRRGIS